MIHDTLTQRLHLNNVFMLGCGRFKVDNTGILDDNIGSSLCIVWNEQEMEAVAKVTQERR